MKPVIELKSIQIHVKLSQETPAYTGKIFVNGKYFSDVENQGFGGPDSYFNKNNPKNNWNEVEELNKIIGNTYPKHVFSSMELEESLEMICHKLAWLHVDQRNLKSKLSKNVMTFEDGKVYTYKGRKSEELMDKIFAKNPNGIILNRMKFEDVWLIISELSK